MKRQTIYLKNGIEDKIRDVANKEGKTISEVIRKRIALSFQQEDLIEHLEDKIDAIYQAINLLSGDIAYIAGATRASSRTYEDIRLEASAHENKIKQKFNAIGKTFRDEDYN